MLLQNKRVNGDCTIEQTKASSLGYSPSATALSQVLCGDFDGSGCETMLRFVFFSGTVVRGRSGEAYQT